MGKCLTRIFTASFTGSLGFNLVNKDLQVRVEKYHTEDTVRSVGAPRQKRNNRGKASQNKTTIRRQLHHRHMYIVNLSRGLV